MEIRFESLGLVKDLLLSEATLDNAESMPSFIMLIFSFTADLVSVFVDPSSIKRILSASLSFF